MKAFRFVIALAVALCCVSTSAFAIATRAPGALEAGEEELAQMEALMGMVGSAACVREVYEMKAGDPPEAAFYEGMLLRLARAGKLGSPAQDGVFAADEQIKMACLGLIEAEPWRPQGDPQCPCITRGEGGYHFDVETGGGVIGARLYSATALEGGLYDLCADVYEVDPDADVESADIEAYFDAQARWIGHLTLRARAGADAVMGYVVVSYQYTPYAEHVTYGYVHTPDGEAEIYLPSVFRRFFTDEGFSGVTEDGKAALYLTMALNEAGSTYKALLQRRLVERKGDRWSWNLGEGFHVITWEEENRVYALKEYITDEAIYSLLIEYDKSVEYEYSLYTELLQNSFTVKTFGVG